MNRALCIRNRQRAAPVDLRALRRLALSLLQEVLRQTDFDLGIYLLSAAEMARLNETFLRHAGPTDVITFDYGLESRPRGQRRAPGRFQSKALHGEIVICMDVAVDQARQFRAHWASELARYLIHGVLHLRGFDDRTPRARLTMKREEDRLLRELSRRFGRPETIVKRRAVKARRSAERVKRS